MKKFFEDLKNEFQKSDNPKVSSTNNTCAEEESEIINKENLLTTSNSHPVEPTPEDLKAPPTTPKVRSSNLTELAKARVRTFQRRTPAGQTTPTIYIYNHRGKPTEDVGGPKQTLAQKAKAFRCYADLQSRSEPDLGRGMCL
ncbi:unnamed protein product [Mesocestoides corti]|uniref:Uncharacterized protein n=1 Tax=Mesocestoides corti TaxID=53468 RepID=A0A0R3UBH7_MESCO|nr:unnamed protein product [Mesocestoides corti]